MPDTTPDITPDENTGPISEVLARPKNKPRGMILLLTVLILTIIGFLVYGVLLLNASRMETTEHAIKWEARYESLFEDYRQLDSDCRKSPDCKTTAPNTNNITEPSVGINGTNGSDGSDGLDGINGIDGETPTAAQMLDVFRIYCSELVCVGPPGSNSTVPGPAGEDSTVPGPIGQTGLSGNDGVNGINGTNGKNGEPPFSWITTKTLPNGTVTTKTCNRTDPFNKAEPTYVCTIK